MQTIELTLQFNTPVFARGGSDGFEITPQSIKGIMRFWYRALLPNVIDIHRCGKDTKPYCGMKRAEELLFGSTTQRSLFDVEVEIRGMRQDYGT
ncbi:MAG TPA: type III-B CRISPR module RAMP protein Cmr1, partial [Thermotogota bacterium]|nr:type III-B CRISPR module RAMP protein Cmr1 [Thermotogota bacterium]